MGSRTIIIAFSGIASIVGCPSVDATAPAEFRNQQGDAFVLQRLIDVHASSRTITVPAGTYVLDRTLIISGMHDVVIEGQGVTLRSNGNLREFFQVIGAQRVRLRGFHIEGPWSASLPSTGSKPAVLVGSLSPQENRTNDQIEISDFVISGADWAAVMVYGRYGHQDAIKNSRIYIHDNIISDSSTGVFVYKNASNVRILRNDINKMALDGIAVDSRAATDEIASEPNYDIRIARNLVSGCGINGQGIGILIKGLNRNVSVSWNRVSNVGTVSNYRGPVAIGIGVVPDSDQKFARSVKIGNNFISGIWPESTRGYGILIVKGATNTFIKENTILHVGTEIKMN